MLTCTKVYTVAYLSCFLLSMCGILTTNIPDLVVFNISSLYTEQWTLNELQTQGTGELIAKKIVGNARNINDSVWAGESYLSRQMPPPCHFSIFSLMPCSSGISLQSKLETIAQVSTPSGGDAATMTKHWRGDGWRSEVEMLLKNLID